MEELVWFILSAVIGIAVLYFVVKAAVKAAILEVRAQDQAKEAEKPKEEEPAAPPEE